MAFITLPAELRPDLPTGHLHRILVGQVEGWSGKHLGVEHMRALLSADEAGAEIN